jgi:hypothetical protein
METGADIPSIAEQIAWLRDRANDAALIREYLVQSGSVNVDRAERDAVMWDAVLASLESIAKADKPHRRRSPRQNR